MHQLAQTQPLHTLFLFPPTLSRTHMCTCMHKKQLHTSHHTKSRLACAPQTHTSPSVTASVLIYRHCLASLCHLVVVSDQLEVFRECVCVFERVNECVCSYVCVHVQYMSVQKKGLGSHERFSKRGQTNWHTPFFVSVRNHHLFSLRKQDYCAQTHWHPD